MQLILSPTLTKLPEQLIIPLAKSKKLTDQLQKIANWTGTAISVLKRDFTGINNQIIPIYFQKEKESKTAYLLGLGENPTIASIETTFLKFVKQQKKQLSKSIGIHLLVNNEPIKNKLTVCLEGMTRGIYMGGYEIGKFKSKKAKRLPFTEIISFCKAKSDKKGAAAMNKGIQTATTICSILDLVNAPSNKKLPSTLANWAKASGKKNGFRVRVMEKAEIEKVGLHALLAVNRGSEFPPAFIIMEYQPKKSTKKVLPKIGLVGKGVTFDTGGLSIKGSQNMHYMKSDMGGAAAVLGTMEATAKLQLPVHLVGIVPATDNSVDALSIKPSDVIDSYSGKTIEVIDTDAEGRLILADGLAYMDKHFQPDVMINLATLTGSSVRALGFEAGALFSKNERLNQALMAAGMETGDQLWPLPMWDAYAADLQSDVADIKNLGAQPVAGAIRAAKFLEFFTNNHPAWAHLDIAGVAFGSNPLSKEKSATGFGIKLLLNFLENGKYRKNDI